MKVLLSLVLLVAAAVAEPPLYRQQQRQYYFARQQEAAAPEAPAAPYPPSGWKPAGPAFNLPQRQVQSPQQQYGAPQQQYGAPQSPEKQYGAPSAPQRQYGAPSAPQQQYGAPTAPQQQYGAPPQQQYGPPQYGPPEEGTTVETPNTTEVEDSTTVSSVTESESEPVNSVNELEDDDVDQQQPQQSGEYYIALPDGRLQRVRYISRQDVEAMKYFAKIRAENVEPLRGPIYAYAPLQKLQILPAGLQLSVAPVAPVAAAATPIEPVKPEKINAAPAKLEIEPVAAQVQYQYDNPSPVLPLAPAYTANFQVPESRYLLTVQS